MSEALNNLIGFFARGGLFMWPLLICSIFALTTIILRGFALREKKRDATGGRERDRATNARREPGSVDANCRERSVFPRSNRARRAPAFAFASFRERGGGANARSSRDGDPGKGPDRAGSDRRYRAVVGSDR